MNFAIAGNSLLNDGEVIANFVPRIRGLYSANLEEPLRLLLEVTREGAPPQTIRAMHVVGALEISWQPTCGCSCHNATFRAVNTLTRPAG